MSRISARIDPGQFDAAFSNWYRFAEQRMERAMLLAVDGGRRKALSSIREAGQGSGLGRLFNGLGSSSDLSTGRGIHRSNGAVMSASGVIFIRSGSERTRGAIEAYTEGANIAPVRAKYLWITSDDLPRVTRRYRMTPARYNAEGWDKKIGPLVFVRLGGGRALLIVKNVGVSNAGKARSARSLRKNGMPRKGQVARENLVAFIGIPRTSRQARVNVASIMAEISNELGPLFYQALGRI